MIQKAGAGWQLFNRTGKHFIAITEINSHFFPQSLRDSVPVVAVAGCCSDHSCFVAFFALASNPPPPHRG